MGRWLRCRKESHQGGLLVLAHPQASRSGSPTSILPALPTPLTTPPTTAAVAELEASKSSDARVRRLFVDPLGRHALLTLQTSSGGGGLVGSLGGLTGGGGAHLETFYVDGGLKKARPLAKLKGLAVTSVAWSPVLRANSFGWAMGVGWAGPGRTMAVATALTAD